MMLAQLQQDFRNWLTGPSPETGAPFGPEAATGLAVYLNNYRGQLFECLSSSFPVMLAWMGEEAFREAAIAHIDATPPSAWTLDAYSQGFPASLTSDLEELAWIEQSVADAFVGPDAEPVSADSLASADWDTARLRLTPTLIRRRVETNAAALWSALYHQEEPPAAAMLDQSAGLIVWRTGFEVRVEQIEAAELDALEEIARHGSFADLCAVLVDWHGESEGIALAAKRLSDWLGRGLIVGLD